MLMNVGKWLMDMGEFSGNPKGQFELTWKKENYCLGWTRQTSCPHRGAEEKSREHVSISSGKESRSF